MKTASASIIRNLDPLGRLRISLRKAAPPGLKTSKDVV